MAAPYSAVQLRLERKRRTVEMEAAGMDTETIAAVLQVSVRSVMRYREELGLTQPRPAREWTDAELRLITNLLDDGCPYAEVARTIPGVTVCMLQHQFPGRGASGSPLGNGHHMRLAEALGLGMSYS